MRDVSEENLVAAGHREGNAWIVADDVRVKGVPAEIAVTTARAVPHASAQVLWERWITVDQPLGAVEQYRRQGDAPLLAACAECHDVERCAAPQRGDKNVRELFELRYALVPDLLQQSAVSADVL